MEKVIFLLLSVSGSRRNSDEYFAKKSLNQLNVIKSISKELSSAVHTFNFGHTIKFHSSLLNAVPTVSIVSINNSIAALFVLFLLLF